jgi:uncharacterized protein (TIGR02246 family)
VSEDELAIRSAVSAWLEATQRGDIDSVLSLMTEDALFLLPGQPPMTRAAFEVASRSQAAAGMHIEARSDIQEIRVEGALAYLWSRLAVTVFPTGTEPIKREGHTLTVFMKVGGKWLLHRDANLLGRVQVDLDA